MGSNTISLPSFTQGKYLNFKICLCVNKFIQIVLSGHLTSTIYCCEMKPFVSFPCPTPWPLVIHFFSAMYTSFLPQLYLFYLMETVKAGYNWLQLDNSFGSHCWSRVLTWLKSRLAGSCQATSWLILKKATACKASSWLAGLWQHYSWAIPWYLYQKHG